MCVLLSQTEEERQLRKMVRREEKKQTRRKDGDHDVDGSAKGGFNAEELRTQRFVAQSNPLSSTLFLIVAKMSLPKHSVPYWS